MMNLRPTLALAMCAVAAFPCSAQLLGGPNLKNANVHIDRGDMLKGHNSVALGAFRVIFVTGDSTSAKGAGNSMSDSQNTESGASGQLRGLKKSLAQKLTDEIYADFLAQMKAAGYTVVDSQALAAKSSAYKALAMTENGDTGRFGYYVVPTGQMSARLANDDSEAVGRGASKGIFSGFKAQHQSTAKGDAEKAMPEISTETGMPILGVTMVVSFAKFKSSGNSHFVSMSRTSMEVGPTINGIDEANMPMATGIQFWTKDSNKQCVNCYKPAQAELRGDIHTTDHIADQLTTKTERFGDADSFTKGVYKKGDYEVVPADYENSELAQAKVANKMLIDALVKER